MSILGIDYEKCKKCYICIIVCARSLFKNKEQDEIVFNDPQNRCILCGHCIARCPEDAILYEGMGEAFAYEGVDVPEKIASYDTVYKILRANRSIRSYKKDKVSIGLLQKVFEAMSHAPTGGNMRTEKFSILSDKEKIKKLSDAVQEELLKDPALNDRYRERFEILKEEFQSPIFFDAPHVIFVSSPIDLDSESNNIGIIITYGRLAAQALGLGTCWNAWTQISMASNTEIKKLAGIQDKKIGAFIVGYPNEIYYRSPPRSTKQVTGLEE